MVITDIMDIMDTMVIVVIMDTMVITDIMDTMDTVFIMDTVVIMDTVDTIIINMDNTEQLWYSRKEAVERSPDTFF